MYNYDFFNRSSKTDANGDPRLSTPDADEVLQATLQHVVATFDPVDGPQDLRERRAHAQLDPAPGGTLGDWDNTFAFVLGNEVSGNRNWAGVIRLVAIHNRALTPAQIKQNFDAGVGEKFFLMFNVSHLTNIVAELRRVRGRAVRQLLLPVPQARSSSAWTARRSRTGLDIEGIRDRLERRGSATSASRSRI